MDESPQLDVTPHTKSTNTIMSDAEAEAEEAVRCATIDNAEDCGNWGCMWEPQPLISPDSYECTSAALAEMMEDPAIKESMRCQSLKDAETCSEGGCGWVEVSSDLYDCFTKEYATVWEQPGHKEISRCFSFDNPEACGDGGCVWGHLDICSPAALEKSSEDLPHLSYCGGFDEVDECCQAPDFSCIMVKFGNAAICTSDGSKTGFMGENICDGGSDADVASGSGDTDAAGGSGSPSSSGPPLVSLSNNSLSGVDVASGSGATNAAGGSGSPSSSVPLPVSSSNDSSSGSAHWIGGVFVGGVFIGSALTISIMIFVSRFTKRGGRGKRISDSMAECRDEELQTRSIS